MQREQQKRDEEASKTANMGTSTGLKVLNSIHFIPRRSNFTKIIDNNILTYPVSLS